ncbi:hypothetical protein ILYODFUR_037088, partial [Ilyodon furcidens]
GAVGCHYAAPGEHSGAKGLAQGPRVATCGIRTQPLVSPLEHKPPVLTTRPPLPLLARSSHVTGTNNETLKLLSVAVMGLYCDVTSCLSSEFVEQKIEEFLVTFGERLSSLSEETFRNQVTALIKLKECEDAHLGEEVDRNWFEVVTQQYVFDRLNREIEVLKVFTQEELISWFLEHRGSSSRKLSVHVSTELRWSLSWFWCWFSDIPDQL